MVSGRKALFDLQQLALRPSIRKHPKPEHPPCVSCYVKIRHKFRCFAIPYPSKCCFEQGPVRAYILAQGRKGDNVGVCLNPWRPCTRQYHTTFSRVCQIFVDYPRPSSLASRTWRRGIFGPGIPFKREGVKTFA